jgi:hypothetical protein
MRKTCWYQYLSCHRLRHHPRASLSLPHHSSPPPPQGLCYCGLTAPQAQSRLVVIVVVVVVVVRRRPSLVRRRSETLGGVPRQAFRRQRPGLLPQESVVELPGVALRPHQLPVHAVPQDVVRRLTKFFVGGRHAPVLDEEGLPGGIGEDGGHSCCCCCCCGCAVERGVCWKGV